MKEQTQYAWAAGFFDGEGCVSMRHQGRYTGISIIITQKDKRPLQKFYDVFDCVETVGITTRPNRRNSYYRLTLSGKRAAEVLRCMLPYLSLKREVAEVALDLQATIDRYSAVERSAKLPDSEMEYRSSLAAKGRWLNSGRWAAATTKSEGLAETQVCDSLDCTNDKGAEVAEMTTRLQ